jgi:hypothetical protein
VRARPRRRRGRACVRPVVGAAVAVVAHLNERGHSMVMNTAARLNVRTCVGGVGVVCQLGARPGRARSRGQGAGLLLTVSNATAAVCMVGLRVCGVAPGEAVDCTRVCVPGHVRRQDCQSSNASDAGACILYARTRYAQACTDKWARVVLFCCLHMLDRACMSAEVGWWRRSRGAHRKA